MSAAFDMPEAQAPEEYFRVDSEGRAAWVTNKLLSYDEQLARLDAQYKAMRARLEGERDGFRAQFLVPLQQWAEANLPKKGKTIHLLTGSLSFRRVKGGTRIVDRQALLNWCEDHLVEAVTLTMQKGIDAEVVRAHYEDSGEIPPGVMLQEERDEFYIKAAKADKEPF
jgi:phage host-nuclease inhibitor protein Gam